MAPGGPPIPTRAVMACGPPATGTVSNVQEASMSVSLAAKAGLALILVGGVVEFRGTNDPATRTDFLERLAVRVEHAHTVTPQTREVLSRVVERALKAPVRNNSDAKDEARRQLAIVRLESALRAIPTAATAAGN